MLESFTKGLGICVLRGHPDHMLKCTLLRTVTTVRILALPQIPCVTLSKQTTLSEPVSLYVKYG